MKEGYELPPCPVCGGENSFMVPLRTFPKRKAPPKNHVHCDDSGCGFRASQDHWHQLSRERPLPDKPILWLFEDVGQDIEVIGFSGEVTWYDAIVAEIEATNWCSHTLELGANIVEVTVPPIHPGTGALDADAWEFRLLKALGFAEEMMKLRF